MGRISTLLLFACFVATGCDASEAQCVIGQESVQVGESVPLAEGTILCTCTRSGVDCQDTDAGGRRVGVDSLDAGASSPDVAPLLDLGRAVDAQLDLGHGDAQQAELDAALDAQPAPDAGPIECPPFPVIGGFCEGEFQACRYGVAFDCCGTEYPADTTCTCVEGRFECANHVMQCEEQTPAMMCAQRGRVCARWADIQANRDEGMWDGDVRTCDPGVMDPAWRARALLHLNFFRFLAGVKPVQDVPVMNRQAQACALVIQANGELLHELPEDAACWSQDAAFSSAHSNLDRTPAIASMWRYIADPGEENRARLPHRLWLLSPSLRDVGIGSTAFASCTQVIDGAQRDPADPAWVAWPPPGPVPAPYTLLRDGGWSVQSSVINMSRATVSVTHNGAEMMISPRYLTAGGGASWGVAFDLVGWAPQVGETYRVRLDNLYGNGWEGPIEYEVQPIDCQ